MVPGFGYWLVLDVVFDNRRMPSRRTALKSAGRSNDCTSSRESSSDEI